MLQFAMVVGAFACILCMILLQSTCRQGCSRGHTGPYGVWVLFVFKKNVWLLFLDNKTHPYAVWPLFEDNFGGY